MRYIDLITKTQDEFIIIIIITINGNVIPLQALSGPEGG